MMTVIEKQYMEADINISCHKQFGNSEQLKGGEK